MGTIQDLLQEVPLSAVLKERVSLAEQKFERALRENDELRRQLRAVEDENAALRSQIPAEPAGLNSDTARVLAHLFRAEGEDRDVGITARILQIEKGVVKYHLDELARAGMARMTSSNYNTGHVYWSLTPAGRKFAVENKLI